MDDFIVKNCLKHGKLKRHQLIKAGIRNERQQYKCRQCQSTQHKNNYENNKENINKRSREWKKNNIERARELNRIYASKRTGKHPVVETYQTEKERRIKRKFVYLLLDIKKVMRKWESKT